MKLLRQSRQSRVVTAFIALISVLFTQLAIAAYACPAVEVAQAIETTKMSVMAAMDGCEGTDPDQSALCHAHAQVGDQSLYKPAPPDIAPSVVLILVPALSIADLAYHSQVHLGTPEWLSRATDPPLSIQHCCFRI